LGVASAIKERVVIRYRPDNETATKLKDADYLRDKMRLIVDRYYDFGPDREFEKLIEQAAGWLDRRTLK
jgi:hypothetical protein